MEKNQKLPVLGELEATDPKQIVTWAKKTLTKKRDWHYEWLETVISYYGTNQKDDVYEAIRRIHGVR